MNMKKISGHSIIRPDIQEVFQMTSKELLYVEDALGHEQYFKTQCSETASRIQDTELRSFAQDIQRQHQEIFQNFYNLL